MDRGSTTPLREVLDALKRDHLEAGFPADIVERAARATIRAMGADQECARIKARARSYFRTVVRKEVARSRTPSMASARLIADSVVSDLLSSGRSPNEALEELERGWASALPRDVLAEYRERMCA